MVLCQSKSGMIFALGLLCTAFVAAPALGKVFYVDPYLGHDSQDGAETRPWRTLNPISGRNVIQPGDTVYLRDGYYGDLRIAGRRNEGMVTITAERARSARFRSVQIAASAGWRLRGFSVSLSYAQPYQKQTMVAIAENSDSISVENFEVMSVPDASSWSAEDWVKMAGHGISADGTRITLQNNRLKNIKHGMTVSATASSVSGNTIENFSGDGIRGLGNYTTYSGNTVKNCYKVDDNHDDGFQSWSRGPSGRVGAGEVIGVVVRGNTIINYENARQPLRCNLQGIGLFDGTFVDWVIENNVIVVDHWHGITVMGARNVRIVNNTVIDANRIRPGPPWITITRHKDGTPPQNSFIVNNIAESFNLVGNRQFPPTSPTGVTMHHNLTVTNPHALFRDMQGLDLRPKQRSAAVDQGDPRFAPSVDIRGKSRPQGRNVDIGAYEVLE